MKERLTLSKTKKREADVGSRLGQTSDIKRMRVSTSLDKQSSEFGMQFENQPKKMRDNDS